MKQQTYILKMQDADGITKNFYRFSCKQAKTVKKMIVDAVNGSSRDFWLWNWGKDGVENILCIATPDGYTETETAWSMTLDELKAM